MSNISVNPIESLPLETVRWTTQRKQSARSRWCKNADDQSFPAPAGLSDLLARCSPDAADDEATLRAKSASVDMAFSLLLRYRACALASSENPNYKELLECAMLVLKMRKQEHAALQRQSASPSEGKHHPFSEAEYEAGVRRILDGLEPEPVADAPFGE